MHRHNLRGRGVNALPVFLVSKNICWLLSQRGANKKKNKYFRNDYLGGVKMGGKKTKNLHFIGCRIEAWSFPPPKKKLLAKLCLWYLVAS